MTAAPRSRPTSVVGRPGDGPVSGTFEVVDHQKVGVYRSLTVSAPELAQRAKPGQFIEVAVRGESTLLRRPFSIANVATGTGQTGTVTFVYDIHGPGTEWLGGVQVHSMLDIVGPLGTSFPIPNVPVSCMLVAGGYGAAPLFWLGDQLKRAGMRVDFINGAATHERLHGVIEAKRTATTSTFTTDDGTYGTHGRVTDVLAERIEACDTDVVYTVGPMGMLRAVAEMCAELEVPCQVAVEEHMACGVGVCWTCVLPVKDSDGTTHHRRACIDGPVFPGNRINWSASRWSVGASVTPDDEPEAPVRRTDQELFG